MGKCRDELRAGDPIQCPDGTWCMWSGDVPRMWGSAELTMRSEVSARLGSLDRALELMAGGAARWDALASLHPELHRALTRRLKTYTAPPPPPAVPVDHKAKQAALREARLEREAAAREAAAARQAQREAAAKIGRESQKAAAAAREGERRAAAIEAQRKREAIREARRQTAAERKRQAWRERRARQAALREARLEREAAKRQERKAIRELERQQAQEAQEAARAAQAELDHKILAIYRLFGSKNRAAHYCQCSPSRINDAMRRLDAAQIPKRAPSLAEVRHVMGTLQMDATMTSRALAAAARLHKLKDKTP